jgi:hypothetical protein
LGLLLQGQARSLHQSQGAWSANKLAADQGNAGGQNSLGFLYQQGRGGLPKARLYKFAADQGDDFARTALGTLIPLVFHSSGKKRVGVGPAERPVTSPRRQVFPNDRTPRLTGAAPAPGHNPPPVLQK